MNKRHYEHTLPNIRGSLSNTYVSIEIELPKGSVYKLLGKELTWDDEPVELQTETEKR